MGSSEQAGDVFSVRIGPYLAPEELMLIEYILGPYWEETEPSTIDV